MDWKKIEFGNNIGSFFSIILLFLFTLCIVSVMVVGASVYQNIADRMEEDFNKNTAASYIANKVRQYDKEDGVAVTEIDGQAVLELKDVIGDIEYKTFIYYLDGSLRELYIQAEDELPLEAGREIIDAKGAGFQMITDRLLFVTVEGEQGIQSTYVSLRSGEQYGK